MLQWPTVIHDSKIKTYLALFGILGVEYFHHLLAQSSAADLYLKDIQMICVCVCVCVRESERERKNEGGGEERKIRDCKNML